MGDLVLKGSTSGQITVTPTAVAGTNTLTLPAKTGNIITSADSGTVTQTMLGTNVAGNGPAFSVYQSSPTSITTGTFTKIAFQSEEFDTNNNFDNTTNYRFTPTVAGYYQINGCVSISSGIANQELLISIYKNGSEYKRASDFSATLAIQVITSSIVYCNGTTDYIELYVYQASGGTKTTTNSSYQTWFNGAMVRAA